MRLNQMLFVMAVLVAASQSMAVTNYQLEVLRDNPLHYWTFDEVSGAANSSTNNLAVNQLLPQGTAGRVTHSSIGSGLKLGSAANFDGSAGGRFQAANLDGAVIDFVPTQHWAIEFWVQAQGPNAGTRNQYLFEGVGAGGANNPGVILDFQETDKLELFAGNRTGQQGPSISDQNWHHVVATFYGNDGGFGIAGMQDFYIDGQLVNTATGSNFSAGFALVQLAVGNAVSPNNANFNGRIDEVAIYDIGSQINLNPQNAANRNSPAAIAQLRAVTQGIADHFFAATAVDKGQEFLKPVTYSYAGGVQPSGGNRSDPLSLKLTDGIVARTDTGANLNDNSTVGINDPAGFNGDNGQAQPQITFDFGKTVAVGEVWIDYIGSNNASGVSAPDRVEISFSGDGVNFGAPQVFSNFNDTLDTNAGQNLFASRRLALDIVDTGGQFARLRFFSDQEWVFLSEVTFVSSAVVPEPASLALLATGGAAMLLRRRRVMR
jgi:hypothetical protein